MRIWLKARLIDKIQHLQSGIANVHSPTRS